MTPHMLDFIRTFAWYADIRGPVLEIGSFIEAAQEHLDMRRAFPPGKYLGVDVLPGPGVDRQVDLFNSKELEVAVEEVGPRVVLCLYVIEHVWEIQKAAAVLGDLWRKNPESWLFVATHQNQPFHGTDHYGDFWRITALGFQRLMIESGTPDIKVFVLGDTSNPGDVLAIRQPLSVPWPGEAMSKAVSAVSVSECAPTHWEQYC